MVDLEAVLAFRHQFRAESHAQDASNRYSGLRHFGTVCSASLAILVAAVLLVGDVRPWEWLVVPSSFFLANIAEYLVHRGPMHRRRRALALLYERHTLMHHRFFTSETMACDSNADFRLVLFPPSMFLVFFGLIAAPIAFVLFLLASWNAGLLFVATVTGYFLCYECLHLAYHLPETSPIARLPLMRLLRLHHARHHDPRFMAHWNFNITFPIGDLLFGTWYRPPRR